VNLGICIDGQTADGAKQPRNVREVFQEFLEEHYGARLSRARQVGKWKGHPISHTNWIGHCTGPGVLYLGEAARITHHVTGEGIYQAMQSAVYAGDAIADVLSGAASEAAAWGRYTRRIRLRFTGGILMGHLLRAVMHTPLLDGLSVIYNHPRVRRAASWAIGSALAGHT
jgi:flavin-dependent dehydrogenase